MTIVEITAGTFTIDMSTELKTTYPNFNVYVDNVEKSQTLPTNVILDKGVYTIKVLMRNTTQSYTETRCFLYDPALECEVASFYSTSEKDVRSVTNVPYLYYILVEGTKDITTCGCLCGDLKNIYQDIKDEIFGSSC